MTLQIIVDTREQNPWDFAWAAPNVEVTHTKLHTGDYSLVGHEDRFCIERKSACSEFASNISQDRFKREIERLKNIEFRYLIIECSYDELLQFPDMSNLPKRVKSKIRAKGPFLLMCTSALQVNHKIPVLLCGDYDNAQRVALSLMKRYLQYVETEKKYSMG